MDDIEFKYNKKSVVIKYNTRTTIKRLITVAGGVPRLAKMLGMSQRAILQSVIKNKPSRSLAILVGSSRELGRSFTKEQFLPKLTPEQWDEFICTSTKLAEFRIKQATYEASTPWPDPDSPVHEWLLQQLEKGE